MGAGGGRTEPALGPQDSETTYFCNTCGQPLCARCRDETHRARMFASHEIVALGQRSRDVLPKCSECGVATGPGRGWDRAGRCPGPNRRPSAALHAEAYIMFSTDKKSLLCIRCFRDMQGWVRGAGGQRGSRCGAEPGSPAGLPQGEPGPLRGPRVSLCAGLRAAGAGGAGERGVPCTPRQGQGWGCARAQEAEPPLPQAVKALQTATREAIALLQAMVEEVRRSAAEEEAAIHALFGSMQVRGVRTGRP